MPRSPQKDPITQSDFLVLSAHLLGVTQRLIAFGASRREWRMRLGELRRNCPRVGAGRAGTISRIRFAQHKRFEPAEDAHPSFAVTLGRFEVAGESFLRDPNQSSSTRFFRAARMQGVDDLRSQFPTYH